MKPKIGQSVKVFSPDQKKFIGTGKYIGSERMNIMGMKMWMPKLKVGKKIYRGLECWWITESEANKVENKISKSKQPK